jgi:hypothetical protein
MAFGPIHYPSDYRTVISSYRPQGRSKKPGISGQGVGVAVLRAAMQAKMERSSSCFRPSGRAACNHPGDEGRPQRAGGSRWTSPHTLSIPIVRRWKEILRKSRRLPAGKARSPWRTPPVPELRNRVSARVSTSDDWMRLAPGLWESI